MRITALSVVLFICAIFAVQSAPIASRSALLDARSPKKAAGSGFIGKTPKSKPKSKAPKAPKASKTKAVAKPTKTTSKSPTRTAVVAPLPPKPKPKAPKAPKPKAPAAPKTPKPKAPAEPKSPKPKAPKAPKVPVAPKSPKPKAPTAPKTPKPKSPKPKAPKAKPTPKPPKDPKSPDQCKAGIKARATCNAFGDDCVKCVQNAECGFNTKARKCEEKCNATGNLVKSADKCPAKDPGSSSSSQEDAQFEAAAAKFFASNIQNHIFKGEKNKASSGRHMLQVWQKDNKGSTITNDKNIKTTGLLEVSVPNRKITKTVWNDKPPVNGEVSYTEGQVSTICKDALAASFKAAPGNLAKVAGQQGSKTPELSLSGKANDENGFVVKNPVTGSGICVHVNANSCYPLLLTSVNLAPATGGITVQTCSTTADVQD